jgi:hypothetical protein
VHSDALALASRVAKRSKWHTAGQIVVTWAASWSSLVQKHTQLCCTDAQVPIIKACSAQDFAGGKNPKIDKDINVRAVQSDMLCKMKVDTVHHELPVFDALQLLLTIRNVPAEGAKLTPLLHKCMEMNKRVQES